MFLLFLGSSWLSCWSPCGDLLYESNNVIWSDRSWTGSNLATNINLRLCWSAFNSIMVCWTICVIVIICANYKSSSDMNLWCMCLVFWLNYANVFASSSDCTVSLCSVFCIASSHIWSDCVLIGTKVYTRYRTIVYASSFDWTTHCLTRSITCSGPHSFLC